MDTQIDFLKKIRNGYEFDGLEKLFHSSSIQGVADKLFIKVTEAKIQNSKLDTTEQLKMIDYLNQANSWLNQLHAKFEGKDRYIYDLELLNKQLLKRIEILEKQILTNKEINKL